MLALLLCAPAVALFIAFYLVPMVMIALLSIYTYSSLDGVLPTFTIANYLEILTDDYYHELYLNTIFVGVLTAIATAVLGLPEAYILSRMRSPWRSIFLLVILGPLLISLVVRTTGWLILLGNSGLINSALLAIGLVESRIQFLYSMPAIVLGLTHVLLPFMVIPIWTALQKQKDTIVHAAHSLGAGGPAVFFRIVVPVALPGLLSGSLIVFSLAASAFATPAIMGGRRFKVVSTAVYEEFTGTLNWPLGASLALVLLVFTLVTLVTYNRLVDRRVQRWS